MKFIVSRVGGWDENQKPCIGAFRGVKTIRQGRDKLPNQDWFKIGENHCEKHGFFYRDKEFNIWLIEITTLEELVEFMADVGHDLIIGMSRSKERWKTITIYDDYIE